MGATGVLEKSRWSGGGKSQQDGLKREGGYSGK